MAGCTPVALIEADKTRRPKLTTGLREVLQPFTIFRSSKMAIYKVDREALHKAAERSTRASAKLEGRELPPDYRRSDAVRKFLEERKLSA